MLFGLAGSFYAVSIGNWGGSGFAQLNVTHAHALRIVVPSTLSLTLGVQIVFASFFLSVLGLARR